jgi:hypothetical protein
MKLLPTLMFAALVLSTPAGFAAGESLQQILSDAQTAYLQGDMVTAKRNFEIVIQLDPKNQVARNYLRIIQSQLAAAPKGSQIEKQLSTVILPKVDLKEATLGSVFEYLRQQVPKVTGGKSTVNFVIQVPDADLQTKQVTLQLTSVPFTVALKYLCDLAELQAEYQQYAIKITPRGAGAKPIVPAAEASTVQKIPGLAN